ncbi:MAG: hypothetical protein EXS39_06930 [Opitutaceae bacterium]|nr:hypothetical protein [Opitutaceae bacterium]
MQDPFTGQPTCLRGSTLLGLAERGALQDDHERRLEALARLGAAAAECGLRADSDRDLVLLAEDEVSLLEGAGSEWATLGAAIRAWRVLLPLRSLGDFGFLEAADNPLEEANPRLRHIGGGVEAWAFAAVGEGSVYKFYLPREEKHIGSAFGFQRGGEALLLAEAQLGDYRALLEKLLLIQALGGMATEVVAVTREGILVAKQTLGEPLPQGDDMSGELPAGLIEIPSRFLRANRDHPRLFFLRDRAFLVADLHARNFVRGTDQKLHVIDLVAAPWPEVGAARESLIADWLARVQVDPTASVLPGAKDEEL